VLARYLSLLSQAVIIISAIPTSSLDIVLNILLNVSSYGLRKHILLLHNYTHQLVQASMTVRVYCALSLSVSTLKYACVRTCVDYLTRTREPSARLAQWPPANESPGHFFSQSTWNN